MSETCCGRRFSTISLLRYRTGTPDVLLLTLESNTTDKQDLPEKLGIKVKIKYKKILPYGTGD
jgi:hypothetical protein